MIAVEYYPSGETSPLPNGQQIYTFITFQEFKRWVQSYVCVHCLVDFKEQNGYNPLTLAHWLDMGCGCEIGIDDPNSIIEQDALMVLPENFENTCKNYEKIYNNEPT
jgi:hypothetical protein